MKLNIKNKISKNKKPYNLNKSIESNSTSRGLKIFPWQELRAMSHNGGGETAQRSRLLIFIIRGIIGRMNK